MKYEYLVGGLGIEWRTERVQETLNNLGNDGWKLVSVVVVGDINYMYLMRERKAEG